MAGTDHQKPGGGCEITASQVGVALTSAYMLFPMTGDQYEGWVLQSAGQLTLLKTVGISMESEKY